MTVLLLKLTLSPTIIAVASLLTRRFGPTVGGWLIGLPVTAGPVALFLALDHGANFAARVSTGFVAGVSGQAAFVLGYVALARRGAPWMTALLAGTAASRSPASHSSRRTLAPGVARVRSRNSDRRLEASAPCHSRRTAAPSS